MRYEIVRDGEYYAILDHKAERAYGHFYFEETRSNEHYMPGAYEKLRADIMVEDTFGVTEVSLRVRRAVVNAVRKARRAIGG